MDERIDELVHWEEHPDGSVTLVDGAAPTPQGDYDTLREALRDNPAALAALHRLLGHVAAHR